MKLEEINNKNIKIETARLILRPFEETDLEDFHEYTSAAGVGEAAGWKHHESKEESEAVLKELIAGRRTFAIEEKESGKVIGSVGFENSPELYKNYNLGENINDIGYIISRDYWGKDYAVEALIGAISYAFFMLHLDAVTCACFKDNEASKKIIEKSGFKPVAIGKYVTQLGEKYDAQYYGLTHEEYGVVYKLETEDGTTAEQPEQAVEAEQPEAAEPVEQAVEAEETEQA